MDILQRLANVIVGDDYLSGERFDRLQNISDKGKNRVGGRTGQMPPGTQTRPAGFQTTPYVPDSNLPKPKPPSTPKGGGVRTQPIGSNPRITPQQEVNNQVTRMRARGGGGSVNSGGLFGNAGILTTGLSLGFAGAEYGRNNWNEGVSTSGRGSGRAAFVPGNRAQGVLQPAAARFGPNPNYTVDEVRSNREKMAELAKQYKKDYPDAFEQKVEGGDPPKNPNTENNNNQPSQTGREVDRSGSKGTQTSLAPVKPETFDAIAARYQALNPGIRYNQDFNFYNENSGSSSNSLPTTPGNVPDPRRAVQIKTGLNAGQTLYRNDPDYQAKLDGEMGIGTREFLIDGNTEREIAQGAQRGSSGAFDVGEQGTQVSSGLNQALDGVTAYDPSKYKGDVNSSAVAQQLMLAKGRDRRGEAFLDGSANSFEALRGAELAQGYITAGGEKYGRGKDGELQKLSSDAVAALKADPNAVASQDFLAQYMNMPATPADQQSSDSAMPVAPSTVTPEQLRDQMSLGSPFFETDATKIDGIQGWTELPGDNREYLTRTLPARADVSEPSHSWLPTEYEMEQSLYETREPYMRYSSN